MRYWNHEHSRYNMTSASMNYPIVQVKTPDDVWLYGLYLRPENSGTIFVNIHGTASNFYEGYFIEVLAQKFWSEGISMLSTNNRGAGVYDAYQKTGAAVEKFEDCVIDINAWMEFVIKEGFKNIILSGHSLGAEKIVYYMNHGKYADKIYSIVLLAPADSYGSHYLLDGKINSRLSEVKEFLKLSEELVGQHKGDTFLPRNTYGSHAGIMPKSAESFLNFLRSHSKVLEGLPFYAKRLASYSKIKVPILAIIGDQHEYTALPVKDALGLMKRENKNTQAFQIKDCDHDFQGKEEELSQVILNFLQK